MDIRRHLEVFDPTQFKLPVHLIGCGAVGSRVGAALFELGVLTPIHLWDFDKVEPHNLANQMFCYEDINKPKILALEDWCKWKVGDGWDHKIFTHNEPFQNHQCSGIVFLMVDTMKARREIGAWLRTQPIQLIIETRMSSSYGNVLMWSPNQFRQWESTLISDDVGEVSACGTSITVGTTASFCANIAVWQMINFINGEPIDEVVNFYLNPLLIGKGKYEDFH